MTWLARWRLRRACFHHDHTTGRSWVSGQHRRRSPQAVELCELRKELGPVIVYISIGNSDDKLTQREWSAYYSNIAVAIQRAGTATTLHGQWVSEPASAWQNACWCIGIGKDSAELLKLRLAEIAQDYRQDSVAWAVAETELITTEGESR